MQAINVTQIEITTFNRSETMFKKIIIIIMCVNANVSSTKNLAIEKTSLTTYAVGPERHVAIPRRGHGTASLTGCTRLISSHRDFFQVAQNADASTNYTCKSGLFVGFKIRRDYKRGCVRGWDRLQPVELTSSLFYDRRERERNTIAYN